MITEIIQKWEENKAKLEEYFKKTEQGEYQSYENIVKKIFEICINVSDNEYDNFNLENLHVIDDGDYQGTQLFLIPKKIYQPGAKDYVVTDTYYGSCSGCDTLQGICNYNEKVVPNDEQLKEYMTLSLHLIQKMHWFWSGDEECINE